MKVDKEEEERIINLNKALLNVEVQVKNVAIGFKYRIYHLYHRNEITLEELQKMSEVAESEFSRYDFEVSPKRILNLRYLSIFSHRHVGGFYSD